MHDEMELIPCPGCHGKYTDGTRKAHMRVCAERATTRPEAYLSLAQYRELHPDLGAVKAKAEAAPYCVIAATIGAVSQYCW